MKRFSRAVGITKLLPRLGYINILRVAKHRILLKLRIHSACRLRANISNTPFFKKSVLNRNLLSSNGWIDTLKYFDWYETPIPKTGVPNWFSRPFSGGGDWPSTGPWWKLGSTIKGDVKEIWDLSRFNWVLAMAQRAANGNIPELDRLNEWLSDWSKKNPPYNGPNWACGQEASIRVMHLAIAAAILEQDNMPSPAILSFVRAHLSRIASTLNYALSQDNNHGILEAAGLFIGGEWIHSISQDVESKKIAELGRKWLEERVQRLITADGGFSMYSVAYHREFLDALSICEYWRRRYELRSFSALFLERAKNAAYWLKAFTNSVTGDAPNIGANDGTRLLPLTDTGYRDFRPSVQLACVLFGGAVAYSEDGSWNLPLNWLDLEIPMETLPSECSRIFDDCGFAVIRGFVINREWQVFVRYPRFNFRPSHADALHIDFWVDGKNLFRDGGSYSYDPELGLLDYFTGVESHNTVQFSGYDQMPRYGTFLFGDWLGPAEISDIETRNHEQIFNVRYRSNQLEDHHRSINLAPGKLVITDKLQNFAGRAVLRWRLESMDWQIKECVLTGGNCRIHISSDVPIDRFEIVDGYESRYYLQMVQIPVLEVGISSPGVITTTFYF